MGLPGQVVAPCLGITCLAVEVAEAGGVASHASSRAHLDHKHIFIPTAIETSGDFGTETCQERCTAELSTISPW